MPFDFTDLLAAASQAGSGTQAGAESAERLTRARARSKSMRALMEQLFAGGGGGAMDFGVPSGGGGDLGGAFVAGSKVHGNVDQWITGAMKATGLPERYRGILRTLVQKESGGNPNAVNNWDINARRGTPSKGLAQTIPSTFSAYRLRGFQGATPGEGQIFDPEENLAAAIRYALSRYGSLGNLPGVRSMSAGGGWRGY
jgi:hypothetical protein